MHAHRQLLFAATLAAIACSGDTGIAPQPAVVVESPALQLSDASMQATRLELMRAESKLQKHLNALSSRVITSNIDPDVAHRQELDLARVRDELAQVRFRLRNPSRPSLDYLSDGTPVYPAETNPDFVTSGTWLTYYNFSFTARSQFSVPVLLHTMIRGNTSTGWTASSDDGLNTSIQVPISESWAFLDVPSTARDCNASAVSVWGSSEHTARYAVSMSVYGVGPQVEYQFKSRSNTWPLQTCPHTPLSGEIVTSGDVVVGGTGSAGALWFGSQSSTVTDCPTTWSAAPDGIVSLSGSSPDSRSVSAVGVGTATLTATCRGVSASASFAVLPTAPVPACGDPNASNYGEHADCTYPSGSGSGGTTGSGDTSAPPTDPTYQPPPPPTYCYTWVEIVNDFDEYGNVTWTYYVYHYTCV